MTDFVKEYTFEEPPKNITYFHEKEPLKLDNNFAFYHSKSKFRKELNKLQNLLKNHLKDSLMALGIRDSYLKEAFSENYLILLFTTAEIVKETNRIIYSHLQKEIEPGCFFIESTSKYLLILSKDIEGMASGIKLLKVILKQTLEHYFTQKDFDDFIKIGQFTLYNCKKTD